MNENHMECGQTKSGIILNKENEGVSDNILQWANMLVSDDKGLINSIDFLKMINSIRVEFGEPEVENRKFVLKVEDELDIDISLRKKSPHPSNGQEISFHHLSLDDCTLVGMRESKGVRRVVLAVIKYLKRLHRPSLPRDYLSALKALVVAEEEKKVLRLELVKETRVANIARAAVITADTDIQLTKFAKSVEDTFIRKNGKPLGRTSLYTILRDWNVITQSSLTSSYASARKWSITKQCGWYDKRGVRTPNLVCYITSKGQEYIVNKLFEEKDNLGLKLKEEDY